METGDFLNLSANETRDRRQLMKAPFEVQPAGSGSVNRVKKPFVPAKWAWHYRTLCRLRNELQDHRVILLADAGEPTRRPGREIADFATEEFSRDLILAELSHNQEALSEIDAALERIELGTYGICEKTGKPIPASRLKAVPSTRFSREAEISLERAGQASRVHIRELHSVRKV
jgi:RNA polymerase-binding transcription factor DksA